MKPVQPKVDLALVLAFLLKVWSNTTGHMPSGGIDHYYPYTSQHLVDKKIILNIKTNAEGENENPY